MSKSSEKFRIILIDCNYDAKIIYCISKIKFLLKKILYLKEISHSFYFIQNLDI